MNHQQPFKGHFKIAHQWRYRFPGIIHECERLSYDYGDVSEFPIANLCFELYAFERNF